MANRVQSLKHRRKSNRNQCSLFPIIREEILSIQDAKQRVGWNITAFDLPETWRHTQGEGVVIAVLDTGCDLDHADLNENLLPGKNLVNPKKLPKDDCQSGHGTHVTGIICAKNNDIGMVGVAPKSKVIPIKVLDEHGNGHLTTVANGIYLAIERKVDIIAMSLGSPLPVNIVRNAIIAATTQGIPVFVAAGNAGNTKEVFFPAAYKETIAIGSIDENFNRSKFSNTGKNLDFMAPGDKIFSTVPDNWYAILSGTSMACPFAVGVAALMLSYIRNNNINTCLKTVEDYKKLLRKHTIPINNKELSTKKFYQGFGIIDPKNLIKNFQ
jgi:major intracellular serine protease